MRRMIVGATLAALSVGASGCFVFVDLDLAAGKTPYRERVLVPAASWWTGAKVALVDLHGVISKQYGDGGLLSPSGARDPVSDFSEVLALAAADRNVRAVVLRIDSPGGFVAWCDVMHRELRAFREKTGKPVVACVTGIGASGGYYVALAADRIVAGPAATVGSIGVIALFLNVEGLAGKIGVQMEVIKSGARKDMGGFWRAMSDEEKGIVRSMIDEFHGRFVDLMVASRPGLSAEKARELADGRLYTATQAKAHGLIDGLAYLDEAVLDARRLAGVEDAALITYARGREYKHNLYSAAPGGAPTVNVVNLNLRDLGGIKESGFYYLWLPE